jgi:hypothetical protein
MSHLDEKLSNHRCKPHTACQKPWVSLRRDQLIPVNKVVNKREQLEKGLEEEEKNKRKKFFKLSLCSKVEFKYVECQNVKQPYAKPKNVDTSQLLTFYIIDMSNCQQFDLWAHQVVDNVQPHCPGSLCFSFYFFLSSSAESISN